MPGQLIIKKHEVVLHRSHEFLSVDNGFSESGGVLASLVFSWTLLAFGQIVHLEIVDRPQTALLCTQVQNHQNRIVDDAKLLQEEGVSIEN